MATDSCPVPNNCETDYNPEDCQRLEQGFFTINFGRKECPGCQICIRKGWFSFTEITSIHLKMNTLIIYITFLNGLVRLALSVRKRQLKFYIAVESSICLMLYMYCPLSFLIIIQIRVNCAFTSALRVYL